MSRKVDDAVGWDDSWFTFTDDSLHWTPSEVYPRLWQSGTPSDDVLVPPGVIPSPWAPSVSASQFDACLTLTPVAGPVGARVDEMRVTFPDCGRDGVPVESLMEACSWAALRHQAGQRVLVRCRGGANRSGLAAGLILAHLEPTWSWEDILTCLRSKRHATVLSNPSLRSLGAELREHLRQVEDAGGQHAR